MIKTISVVIIVAMFICIGIYLYSDNSGSTSSGSPIATALPLETIQPSSTESPNITIKGMMECLPHKNTSGEQTLECAFGIKDNDTGNYYALSDPGWKFLIGAPMNTNVVVTGKLKSTPDTKYNIVGTIELTNLQQ